MKIDHKTMLEAFEETGGRGDMLSIPREDLVRLKAVPLERFAPIFYQLFKWFVDGDETPLEDPIANAMLEGYKEHQRQNALRRKAFLVKQANLSAKGVEARKATHGLPTGYPRVTQAEAKAEAKAKAKAEAQAEAKAFATVGDRAAAVDTAPPLPLMVEEAQKEVKMIAPPIDAKHYSENDRGYYEELKDDGVWNNGESIVNYALNLIREKDKPITRNALKKVLGEIGEEAFKRAVFRFDIDLFVEMANTPPASLQDAPEDSLERTPGKHLLARLRRLQAALRAILAEGRR